MTEPHQARRRRSVVTIVIAVAVVASAVALGAVLGPRLKSPAQAVADAAPPQASLVTARTERRVLAETIVLRGKVAPGSVIKLTVPAGLESPTAVVTAVYARKGSPLREGAVPVEVAGAPLIGLVLPFPLYRDIVAGLAGPDVLEVQRALARLGFRVPINGVFDADTQDTVRRFYRSRGYTAPELPVIGQQPAPAADPPVPGQQPAPMAEPVTAPMLPRTHVLRLDKSDRTISTVPVTVGAILTDPAAPLLTLDASAPTITAVADKQQVARLAAGTAAEVVDEVRGQDATATVRTIGAEPVEADGTTGFPIRLTFAGKALAPTPDHTVRITLATGLEAAAVLAVPVSAVYSHPDGGTFITVTDGGQHTRDITVRTGQSAGGWVEVIPQDRSVEDGAQVVVGSDFRPQG
ncbi:peptidoglycan-binding protein [Actinophytocola sediminis]